MTCTCCDGTGDITIHERAVGINAGIGIPYGQWFSWQDTCPECDGSGVVEVTKAPLNQQEEPWAKLQN